MALPKYPPLSNAIAEAKTLICTRPWALFFQDILTQAASAGGITELTGEVTAGPGTGSQAATIATNAVTSAKIADEAVTLAKIQDAANSSRVLGSGSAGAGNPYSELSLGAGLSITGTTLNTTGGSGGSGNSTYTTAYGSEPAANNGDLDFYTSYNVARYNGSAWQPWGPIFPFTDPNLASISTWVNQGGASVDTTAGGIFLLAPTAAGENWRLRVKTAPSTPYTITAAFTMSGKRGANWAIGLVFRQSSDGKFVHYGCGGAAAGGWAVNNYTNPTTFSSTPSSGVVDSPLWFQMSDDGTNRIHRLSGDGTHWVDVFSVGRTNFLTADQVGFCVNAGSTTQTAGITLLSWKET